MSRLLVRILRRNGFVAGLPILLAGLLTAAPASAVGAQELRSAALAEVLFESARDFGLSRGGQATPADVQLVRTLLDASVRLDPALAEAHGVRYELALLRGDASVADAALDAFVRARPNHLPAFARYVDLRRDSFQRYEHRRAWLDALLGTSLAPAAAAVVQTRLAQVAMDRLDFSAARAALEASRRLDPGCPDAAVAALTLANLERDPLAQFQARLALLALRPGDVGLTLKVALTLDAAGLSESADSFYAHAAGLVRAAGGGEMTVDAMRASVASSQPASESQPVSAPASSPATGRALTAEEARGALASFDPAVLQFVFHPAKALRIRIVPEAESFAVAEPWFAQFELQNVGPVSIALGSDWMINPVFLLSYEVDAGATERFPGMVTLPVDEATSLAPGATLRVRRRLDLGPVRHFADRRPQQRLRIAVRALVDPLLGPDGNWRPAISGLDVPEASFERAAQPLGPQPWSEVIAAARGESIPEVRRALSILALLVAEQQRGSGAAGGYSLRRVPEQEAIEAMQVNLRHASWERRALALDALGRMGLNQQLADAVLAASSDENWVVRLLSVRVLARQRRLFEERVRALANGDPEALVRDAAQSFVVRWAAAPSTNPATPPAESAP